MTIAIRVLGMISMVVLVHDPEGQFNVYSHFAGGQCRIAIGSFFIALTQVGWVSQR